MTQFKRQHPVSAFSRVLAIIKENLITIVVVLFIGKSSTEGLSNIIGIGAVALFILLFSLISWWRYQYRVVDGELNIEQGVFVRKKIYIPRERIQVIDTTSGFLQRMFGLVSLKIRTASGEGGATLSALTREEADDIREALQSKEEQGTAKTKKEPQIICERGITSNELFLTAATSGSIGVIATILGSLMSELDSLISETQIYTFIETLVGSGWQLLILLGGVVILVALLFAFLGTLIRYAHFSIRRVDDTLTIRRGLIEQKTITIPLNRIQAITIDESPARQLLGRATVTVSSVGYGDENGQVTTLFPLLRKKEILPFLKRLTPDFAASMATYTPPLHAKRRYIIKMLLIASVVCGAIGLLTGFWWIFILLIPSAGWGYLQYRSAAVGVSGDSMVARYRIFNRKTYLLKRNRIQAESLRQTPLQKYKNLGNLSIYFAAGKSGQSATVRELDLAVGRKMQYWIGTKHQLEAPEENTGGPILLST